MLEEMSKDILSEPVKLLLKPKEIDPYDAISGAPSAIAADNNTTQIDKVTQMSKVV